MKKKIRMIDTTLRDGMHAMKHRFTLDQVADIAGKLEDANIEAVEMSHGDGLGGSSINYGFAAHSDREYLKAVSSVLSRSKLAILMLPGVGTVEDLEMAAEAGTKVARIATHVTEADIAEEHIRYCKGVGMETVGVLMMTHTVEPEKIVEQAQLMQSYGADLVYAMDSAGAMLPNDVERRVVALKNSLKIPVGFHAHNNLGVAVGNSLKAAQCGVDWLDGTLRGLGAGAGNAQEEVLVVVLEKAGFETGIDPYKIMDAAEILDSIVKAPSINNSSLMLGYAGVYSSFLLHTYKAAEKFKLDPRDILLELGKRKAVGGQEDWIIEVAAQMAQEKQRTMNSSR
jgi:4-hydroxy 2-oxovalerate aldolase